MAKSSNVKPHLIWKEKKRRVFKDYRPDMRPEWQEIQLLAKGKSDTVRLVKPAMLFF